EQQQKYAEQITGSVHSIRLLIDELLELGRIEAGFDTTFELVAFDDIAREVIQSYDHELQVKHHTMITEIVPNVPKVFGNALRLRQVISNLLGNAIKYTRENG